MLYQAGAQMFVDKRLMKTTLIGAHDKIPAKIYALKSSTPTSLGLEEQFANVCSTNSYCWASVNTDY